MRKYENGATIFKIMPEGQASIHVFKGSTLTAILDKAGHKETSLSPVYSSNLPYAAYLYAAHIPPHNFHMIKGYTSRVYKESFTFKLIPDPIDMLGGRTRVESLLIYRHAESGKKYIFRVLTWHPARLCVRLKVQQFARSLFTQISNYGTPV